MKVSEYLAQALFDTGVRHVFLVSGGANLQLVDAIWRHPVLEFVCNHHEQAAAMAAEAYARVTGNLGAALVTTGPGGTNALTGVLCAWQDSIPCLYISGQVRSDRLEDKPIRQLSIQGLDIVELVKPITKYAVTVRDKSQIRYQFEKAIHVARSDRPGPVWLDVPLDILSAEIDPPTLEGFDAPPQQTGSIAAEALEVAVRVLLERLRESRRPVVYIGTGVRLSRAEKEMQQVLERLNIPFLCTWNVQDMADGNDPLYLGSPGTFGTRPANFTVQNSDWMLAIGNRISIPVTGHNYESFARGAYKVVVDIDPNELDKGTVRADLPINCDAGIFLRALLEQLGPRATGDIEPWKARCLGWKHRYPSVLPEYRDEGKWVNSYVFVDVLSEEMANDDVMVLGDGTALTCTFQAWRPKRGQRAFHAGGAAPMGYCLPAAIGACFARQRQRVICITGDGSIQLNLQELQTIVGYALPVKIFMLNNDGYLAIRNTQDQWFGSRYAASSPAGGVTMPDMQKIAGAYGLKCERITMHSDLRQKIRSVLEANGPAFCEIMMAPDQPLYPYMTYGTRSDGSRYALPLEDMYPLLSREELLANMDIPLWNDELVSRH